MECLGRMFEFVNAGNCELCTAYQRCFIITTARAEKKQNKEWQKIENEERHFLYLQRKWGYR